MRFLFAATFEGAIEAEGPPGILPSCGSQNDVRLGVRYSAATREMAVSRISPVNMRSEAAPVRPAVERGGLAEDDDVFDLGRVDGRLEHPAAELFFVMSCKPKALALGFFQIEDGDLGEHRAGVVRDLAAFRRVILGAEGAPA